jgi:hypothetical protein
VPAACLLHADALDDNNGNNGKAALFECFRDTADCREFIAQAGNPPQLQGGLQFVREIELSVFVEGFRLDQFLREEVEIVGEGVAETSRLNL